MVVKKLYKYRIWYNTESAYILAQAFFNFLHYKNNRKRFIRKRCLYCFRDL
jgi:hypothetical protein